MDCCCKLIRICRIVFIRYNRRCFRWCTKARTVVAFIQFFFQQIFQHLVCSVFINHFDTGKDRACALVFHLTGNVQCILHNCIVKDFAL